MNIPLIVAVSAFGLLLGSFLNVVIYRVPRKLSVVLPASRCPACDHPLGVKENIPVISYLLQRGRCGHCNEGISPQYPVVEVAAAGLMVASLLTYGGLTAGFLAATVFLLILLTVSVIDIQWQIIPNVIILPAIALAAPVLLLFGLTGFGEASLMQSSAGWLSPVIGFLIGGGTLFALALLWPSGMGGGDVKLAALMGLFLGPYVIIALFTGFLFGSIGGLVSMGLFGKGRKDLIPFGPYLALGSLFTLYFGVRLSEWYLGLSGFGG
jgi:leader peptidase (prepilin peptidase) / N-methyltransferase